MLSYELWSLSTFPLLVFWMFVAVASRYLIVAGLFFLLFHILRTKQWLRRTVNQHPYRNGQFMREVKWSLITSGIFALSGSVTAVLWQKNYTAIYINVRDYSWLYFMVSIPLAMLIHETYYYWLHRWMHQPKIYPLIHQVHHHSFVASPWTAFSFHPWESLLQAFIIPVIALVLPLHPYAIAIYLTIMTLSSVINHVNVEIYPHWFMNTAPGKWFIGATHHGLHHAQHRYNYGLCFTFWDKWMQTESPEFSSRLKATD